MGRYEPLHSLSRDTTDREKKRVIQLLETLSIREVAKIVNRSTRTVLTIKNQSKPQRNRMTSTSRKKRKTRQRSQLLFGKKSFAKRCSAYCVRLRVMRARGRDD